MTWYWGQTSHEYEEHQNRLAQTDKLNLPISYNTFTKVYKNFENNFEVFEIMYFLTLKCTKSISTYKISWQTPQLVTIETENRPFNEQIFKCLINSGHQRMWIEAANCVTTETIWGIWIRIKTWSLRTTETIAVKFLNRNDHMRTTHRRLKRPEQPNQS